MSTGEAQVVIATTQYVLRNKSSKSIDFEIWMEAAVDRQHPYVTRHGFLLVPSLYRRKRTCTSHAIQHRTLVQYVLLLHDAQYLTAVWLLSVAKNPMHMLIGSPTISVVKRIKVGMLHARSTQQFIASMCHRARISWGYLVYIVRAVFVTLTRSRSPQRDVSHNA